MRWRRWPWLMVSFSAAAFGACGGRSVENVVLEGGSGGSRGGSGGTTLGTGGSFGTGANGANTGTGANGAGATMGTGATMGFGGATGMGASTGASGRMGGPGGRAPFGGRSGTGATSGSAGSGGFVGTGGAAGRSGLAGGAPASGGTGGDFDLPDFGGAAGAPDGGLRVGGVAQKGAFERGTAVVALELDDKLNQTGRTFATQITDNLGRFIVDVNSTTGSYVELTANGFYYDEITDDDSTSQLQLVALSHLGDRAVVNVNVLTELEAPRVAYLRSHGSSFDDAKARAQSEVLAAFGIMLPGLPPSEELDETGSSEGDAALLAISTLLQGYLSVSELSDLMSVIAQDLEQDGTLTDPIAGEELMNAAWLVNTGLIRKQMTARYAALGFGVALPDFEIYLEHFRDSGAYPFVSRIDIPTQGTYGANVLELSGSIAAGDYSLALTAPATEPVRVRFTWTGDSSEAGVWYYSDILNMTATTYDSSAGVQDFVVINPGSPCDVHLSFLGRNPGSAEIDVFEGDAQALTLTREISWGQ